MTDETTTQEVEVQPEMIFLMMLVGEIAGQIGGPDFLVGVDLEETGTAVILTMASREDTKIGRQALVRPIPGAEIRRLAVTMAYDIYEMVANKPEHSGLIVPNQGLIVP